MPDYFTLAELRALPDMASAAKYPDATVESAAAYIVDIIEREVDTSFIARTVTDEVHDGGCYSIALKKTHALAITSVTENGIAVASGELNLDGTILERYAVGTYYPRLWASGRRNVKVTYTAGYCVLANIPKDIKTAAMQATRARLMETSSTAGVNDRRTSLTNETGTVNFVIPGEDRPTGYPAVDEVIIGWKRKLAASRI